MASELRFPLWSEFENKHYEKQLIKCELSKIEWANWYDYSQHLKSLPQPTNKKEKKNMKIKCDYVQSQLTYFKHDFLLSAQSVARYHYENQKVYDRMSLMTLIMTPEDRAKHQRLLEIFPSLVIQTNHDLDLFPSSLEDLQTIGDYNDCDAEDEEEDEEEEEPRETIKRSRCDVKEEKDQDSGRQEESESEDDEKE